MESIWKLGLEGNEFYLRSMEIYLGEKEKPNKYDCNSIKRKLFYRWGTRGNEITLSNKSTCVAANLCGVSKSLEQTNLYNFANIATLISNIN